LIIEEPSLLDHIKSTEGQGRNLSVAGIGIGIAARFRKIYRTGIGAMIQFSSFDFPIISADHPPLSKIRAKISALAEKIPPYPFGRER